MNTTSKASNAFEAFFGIHELPPPSSSPTSPLLPPPPLPRILTSTLKARKLHWRNPTANIGIDIIGRRISQQRHGEHNTDGEGGSRNTRNQPFNHPQNILFSSADRRIRGIRNLWDSPCRSARRNPRRAAGASSLFTLRGVSSPPVGRLFTIRLVHDNVKTARCGGKTERCSFVQGGPEMPRITTRCCALFVSPTGDPNAETQYGIRY